MRAEGIYGAVDRIGGVPIGERMARKAPLRHLDPVLLTTTVALAGFGALMVHSATAGSDPSTFVTRQILFALLGAIGIVGVASFDYRHLRSASAPVYAGSCVLLLLVLSPLGEEVSGAKRWIGLGSFQAQPSELAKLATLVLLAAFLASRKGTVRGSAILVVLAIVALPIGLILAEPDLGTAMVFVFLAAALMLLGGVRFRHLALLAFVGVLGLIAIGNSGLIKDYQKERLTAFLDATPDVRSEGYNLTQSKIAIASGGIRGRGLGAENTQTSLAYVPEQHTDFIFTAVGEQLGFLGSAMLLGSLALLIWRALRIAAMARDLFGTLLAGGIAAMWAFQVFVNVGMTMGIMPITGIPLPFISFGGSSMLANLVAVGILLNVHMRRFL